MAVAKNSLDGREESSVVLVSAYFKYSRPTTDFTEIVRSIAQEHRSLLVCADSNGHSSHWHSQDTNARGRIIEEMIDDLLLHIHNVPTNIPTYERAQMGSSNIDLTLTTANLKWSISNWTVKNDTDSDHNTISFELRTNMKVPKEEPIVTFNVGKADWSKFQNTIIQFNQQADANDADVHKRAVSLTNIIKTAALKSMPLKRWRKNQVTLPPWWTTDLSDSKKTLNLARRSKSPNYAVLRNRHLYLIRSAKMTAWRGFSEKMNTNIWGKAFTWAKKGSSMHKGQSTLKNKDGRYTNNTEETIDTLLDAFIPDDHTPSELITAPNDGRPLTITMYDEIRTSIWKLIPNKAPGKDGITGGMLRKPWPMVSERIIDLFNRCLQSEAFPTPWKEAKLINHTQARQKR